MSKKMLINALHPEESRVAIVDENGQLVDLDIEITGSEQMRGNIHQGVVLRVEPGLQAAFIDIGLKKPGFLQMGELHPDLWQWRDDVPEEQRKKRPRIQEVLRRGQELLVQVEKDERDMKGVALTTYISIPGRYMVIMPGSDSTGISRKVEGEGERKKLKELVKEMTIPEGIGYIIRTEAVGRTLEELQKDLDSLVNSYNDIVAKGKEIKGPALIYREFAVVIRTIRDYFSADIDEVLVDSKEVFKEAKAFFKESMPTLEKRVKMHQEKRPIFSRYQIEEQIDQIYEKKVLLKSGGSLVIEPTEALVSIDVNSGKSTGERGVEDTAFRTNLEAAEEAARQLRLRDLGGLIVLDFIDMREVKHVKEVEKTLKAALKSDKARVTVGRISQFGMLEMSRQRIKQTLEQGSVLDCPHCGGRGKVKGVENMAISFLRKVHAAAAKGTAAEIRGELPLEVAYYLLNRKKRELAQIENDYDIEVTIKGKPSFLMNQLELIVIKRDKAQLQDQATTTMEPQATVQKESTPAQETGDQPGETISAKKNRKSRKKVEPEPSESVSVMEPPNAVTTDEPVPDEPGTDETVGDAGPDEQKKKRKRKRRRKGKAAVGEHSSTAPTPEGAEVESGEPTDQVLTAEPTVSEEDPHADQHKKRKRRRRKRGGAKVIATGEDAPVEAVQQESSPEPESVLVVAPSDSDESTPPKTKSRKRNPRKKETDNTSVELSPNESAPVSAEPLPAQEPQEPAVTARPARTRKKKSPATDEVLAVTVELQPPPAEAPINEKPAKKRAPRRSKKMTPEDAEG